MATDRQRPTTRHARPVIVRRLGNAPTPPLFVETPRPNSRGAARQPRALAGIAGLAAVIVAIVVLRVSA